MLSQFHQTDIHTTSTLDPLTPKDIVAVLESRGWEAEIVQGSSDMNDDSPKCVDGRRSIKLSWPVLRCLVKSTPLLISGTTTLDGLKEITKEVASNGHVPRVHGDHSSVCWVAASSSSGSPEGLPIWNIRPQFDADLTLRRSSTSISLRKRRWSSRKTTRGSLWTRGVQKSLD